MPRRRLAATDLPGWPRLLPAALAAAYIGVSASTLAGLGVQPVAIGRRRLYDRLDLDRLVDSAKGGVQPRRALDTAIEALG